MKGCRKLGLIAAAVFVAGQCWATEPRSATAQTPPAADAATPQTGSFLLTVFLRHDQTKTVEQINEHLRQTGWYDKFPPDGVEIVAWYVMMGIGQVVILRVPLKSCATPTGSSSKPPGVAIAPNFTRPTTSNRSGTQSRTTANELPQSGGQP